MTSVLFGSQDDGMQLYRALGISRSATQDDIKQVRAPDSLLSAAERTACNCSTPPQRRCRACRHHACCCSLHAMPEHVDQLPLTCQRHHHQHTLMPNACMPCMRPYCLATAFAGLPQEGSCPPPRQGRHISCFRGPSKRLRDTDRFKVPSSIRCVGS
jgi:hypothetical protein